MTFTDRFKLKTNPFRITPATNPDDIVWAGFHDIKTKFEKRIKRTLQIPNSTLVLNWGEYGSGKTHAARYFNKGSVLEGLSQGHKPFSLVMPLPKGKEPVYNILSNIVDKIDIDELRNKYSASEVELNPIIESFTDNIQIQNVLKGIFNSEGVTVSLLKRYLYGNISAAELKELNPYGILRTLNNDSDYTKLLAGLFTCLTYNRKIYSAVIIWIDEFEDIATLSNSNVDKINNFLREIIDNTQDNFLLFLNLTQSALFSVEDLGEYLYDNVRSRIKERINFELPSKQTLENYLQELLHLFRTDDVESKYFPFTDDVVEEIIKTLGNVSLRAFNEAFSLLIELADMEDQSPITSEFFLKNKSEIIGWKAQ